MYDNLNWEFPFLISDNGEALCCPLCEHAEGLHLAGVYINQGGRIDKIDGDGHIQTQGAASGRGSRIEISLNCELCGEASSVALQFHKGHIYVGGARRQAPGVMTDEGLDGMWRD